LSQSLPCFENEREGRGAGQELVQVKIAQKGYQIEKLF
jgi:hypothetical protein